MSRPAFLGEQKCPSSVVLPADFMATSEPSPLPTAPAGSSSSAAEPKVLWPWLVGGALVIGTVLVASGTVPLLANPDDRFVPLDEARKGDRVRFSIRGTPVTGRVIRVKKDGTKTLEMDSEYEEDFDERLLDWRQPQSNPLNRRGSATWEKAYREALQAGMKRGEAEEYAAEVVRDEQRELFTASGGWDPTDSFWKGC